MTSTTIKPAPIKPTPRPVPLGIRAALLGNRALHALNTGWWSIDFTSRWTFVGQQNTPPDDGDPGTQGDDHDYDCQESCASMEISFCYGFRQSDGVIEVPDDIEDALEQANPNRPDVGPSAFGEMHDYLLTNWDIGTTDITPAPSAVMYRIWDALCHGKPLRVLRFWRWPGDQYLHWVNVIGLDPTHVIIANPEPLDANGVPLPNPTAADMRQVQSYATFQAFYAGQLILVDGIMP